MCSVLVQLSSTNRVVLGWMTGHAGISDLPFTQIHESNQWHVRILWKLTWRGLHSFHLCVCVTIIETLVYRVFVIVIVVLLVTHSHEPWEERDWTDYALIGLSHWLHTNVKIHYANKTILRTVLKKGGKVLGVLHQRIEGAELCNATENWGGWIVDTWAIRVLGVSTRRVARYMTRGEAHGLLEYWVCRLCQGYMTLGRYDQGVGDERLLILKVWHINTRFGPIRKWCRCLIDVSNPKETMRSIVWKTWAVLVCIGFAHINQTVQLA